VENDNALSEKDRVYRSGGQTSKNDSKVEDDQSHKKSGENDVNRTDKGFDDHSLDSESDGIDFLSSLQKTTMEYLEGVLKRNGKGITVLSKKIEELYPKIGELKIDTDLDLI
jgi:hypothetical protein